MRTGSQEEKIESRGDSTQAVDRHWSRHHAAVSSLAALIATDEPAGIARWTASTEDLHVNLIQLPRDRHIEEHVNTEVEVLILVLDGQGEISIDGERFPLAQHDVSIIRKGARRSLRATSTSMSYITCHRRRAGLWPRPRSDSSQGPRP